MDQLIWSTFLEMMLNQKQTFSKVRIGEICEQAKIHRSTFYRHFEDKYDLLIFGLEDLWQDYLELDDEDKLIKPFQTASVFYNQSVAEKLMKKNSLDQEYVQTVDAFFLKKMTDSFFKSLEKKEIKMLPNNLLALQVASSIQTIEVWADKQEEKLTPKELDLFYKKLVLDYLTIL